MKMVNESLNEFAKKGHLRKTRPIPIAHAHGIDATDPWDDNDDEDDDINIDDIDIDTSDMSDTEEIDIGDDAFDNRLLMTLKNELKIPEFSRRILDFRLKGHYDSMLSGIPLAQTSSDAFIFKLSDGKIKKVNVDDIILEALKQQTYKHKLIMEADDELDLDDDELDLDDNENNLEIEFEENVIFKVNDGRKFRIEEEIINGMNGEPLTIPYFVDLSSEDHDKYTFMDIEHLIPDEIMSGLTNYLDIIDTENQDVVQEIDY